MPRIIANECLIVKDGKVLLGLKKRGFGEGKWNGFGGKPQPGEAMGQAAIREIKEECGITATKLELIGILEFTYEGKPEAFESHIYNVVEYTGEPVETDEMRPQWFDINNLPYDLMWADDIYWMPLFFKGQKFTGTFIYDGYTKIIEHTLIPHDQIPKTTGT